MTLLSTTRRRFLQAVGIGTTASLAGCQAPKNKRVSDTVTEVETVDRVAADPADLPDPIDRSTSKTVEVDLEVKEAQAEIEPGVKFDYMTFDGQIPGPMIRVRQGDTVHLTLSNPDGNAMPHNVDFHAAYGTGGGAEATTVAPGETAELEFKATYPGAFIYHCAVPQMDYHISAGMFGMILVEPKQGLPEVDREFYFGQHELYTDKAAGEKGKHTFDFDAMKAEDPTYVLLNGEKYAYSANRYGPLTAKKDERVRVYMVTGGPNKSSNFHPIGNVWKRAYRDGGLPEDEDVAAYADKNIQTMKVPPGSCIIGTMETPVPERIKLVDHALSRVTRKGLLAEIDVEGQPEPDMFNPEP